MQFLGVNLVTELVFIRVSDLEARLVHVTALVATRPMEMCLVRHIHGVDVPDAEKGVGRIASTSLIHERLHIRWCHT